MASKPAISKPKNAVFDPKRAILALLNQQKSSIIVFYQNLLHWNQKNHFYTNNNDFGYFDPVQACFGKLGSVKWLKMAYFLTQNTPKGTNGSPTHEPTIYRGNLGEIQSKIGVQKAKTASICGFSEPKITVLKRKKS